MLSCQIVKVIEEKCTGCNKCIRVCPQLMSNKVVDYNDRLVLDVNQNYCVACGECIKSCTHEARTYNDDIDEFFEALKKDENISVVVAPAFILNYPNEYKKVFSWLKNLGVKYIYDVSFGADITTYLYVQAIKEKNLKTVIAQPCPVIVNSIERYYPNLLPYLSPIGSPIYALYCCVFKKI